MPGFTDAGAATYGALRDSGGATLTVSLVAQLGRNIVSGQYAGGPLPTECDLSHEFGVSKSVVREAVKILQGKGMIEARGRLRCVRRVDGWALLDADVLDWLLRGPDGAAAIAHFERLRLALEPAAAAIVALKADRACQRPITVALANIRDAVAQGACAIASTAAFHAAIVDGAGNPMFQQLRLPVAMPVVLRHAASGGWACDVSRYVAVHDAIASADAQAASLSVGDLIMHEAVATRS